MPFTFIGVSIRAGNQGISESRTNFFVDTDLRKCIQKLICSYIFSNAWIMSFWQVVEFWYCCQMSKYSFPFLFSAGSKIRTNCCTASCSCACFEMKSPSLFFTLKRWRCPELHFTATLKNTTTKIIQNSTPISTSKLHDPRNSQ